MFNCKWLKDNSDELLLIAILQLVLLCITGIDYIVHHTLYSYGLQFSNTWAIPYWFLLDLSFVTIALLAVSAYKIDKDNFSLGTTIAIFVTICAEVFGGFLDTLWFTIAGIMTGNWHLGFQNWSWHIYSRVFNVYSIKENLCLNLVVLILLAVLWYFRYKIKK